MITENIFFSKDSRCTLHIKRRKDQGFFFFSILLIFLGRCNESLYLLRGGSR